MISQYLVLSRNRPERGDADYLNAATKGMRNADQLRVDNKMNFLKGRTPLYQRSICGRHAVKHDG
jgi:hypothetical protein